MSPAQEQFARMKRYLARMEKRGATDEDTDDLYSFFLHAWHLMDWSSNDSTVNCGKSPEDMKAQLRGVITTSIGRCEDIANRTKHLNLTRPPREAPEITNKHIWVGGNRPAEAVFIFTFPDDTTRDALDLANEVMTDWKRLLKRYGVVV